MYMSKKQIEETLNRARDTPDLDKRFTIVNSIPKTVESYYTMKNGVATKSRVLIQYSLGENGEVCKCYNDISTV